MSTAKDPADLALRDLEEHVAAIFELPDSAQASAFAELRERHPDHAALLQRWEQAAFAVDDAAHERATLPERIGPYRILDLLGEGGMGVVYLAEQRQPEYRRVAVKVVREGMDGNVLARFDAEREAVAMMAHSNIAAVLDAGTTPEGRPYFVLEHIPGVPITEYCDQKRLGLEQRIALFQQVCDGVQHAHDKGVVHRDLKPGNILVQVRGGDPEPKIIDFGVAKALEQPLIERTLYTEPGRILGTPEYMSPEQAETSGLEVDARTDIYSLGVVLYELLTGRLPFESAELRRGGYLEMQRTIREDEPRRPSTRCSDVGAELADTVTVRRLSNSRDLVRALRGNLDWIVMRCLEKDPTRRYASAATLAADLQRHLDDQTVEAGPPSAGRRAAAWARRYRTTLVAAAAAVLALLAARLLWQSPDSGQPAYATTHFEIPDAIGDFIIRPKQIDFTAGGRLAAHTRKPTDALRHGGGIAIWDRATGVSRPLGIPGIAEWDYHSPRWSPDGARIAMLGMRRRPDEEIECGIFVFDEPSGRLEELDRATGDARAHDLCWARDGSRITFVSREWALYDIDMAGDRTRWPITTSSGQWQLGGYSPDGRWLLFHAHDQARGSRDLWVIPAGGGRARRVTSMPGSERYARFAPDGASVWFVAGSGSPRANHQDNIYRIGFDSRTGLPIGQAEQVTFHDNAKISDLAFAGANDGLICRVEHRRTEIRTLATPWSAAGASATRVTHGFDPMPSADGGAIFFRDPDVDRRGLFVISSKGETAPVRVTSLDGLRGDDANYHVRRDGRAIVLAGADDEGPGVFVATVAGSPAYDSVATARRLARTTTTVYPRWSPDGSVIAYIDASDFVIVDVASGESSHVATAIWGWEEWTMRWSPDGSSVIAVGYETPAEKNDSANGVFLITQPEGVLRRLTPLAKGHYKEGVEWHPSGKFLTAVTTDHQVLKIHFDGRPAELMLDEPGHSEYVGSWHPDGRHFFFQCLGGRSCAGGVHVYDSRSRSVRHEAGPITTVPAWDHTGRVAAWSNNTGVDHFEWLRGVR